MSPNKNSQNSIMCFSQSKRDYAHYIMPKVTLTSCLKTYIFDTPFQ